MIENLRERVTTSEDTRAKAVRALGFDEPPVAEKLSRDSFSTDEEFFDACAMLAIRNNSAEYRREYQKIRREYNAQKRAEAQEAADAEHQAALARDIKNCVLSPEEQNAVDERARKLAQADLASGKISFSQRDAAVERYAERLTEEAKRDKVVHADLNRQIREAMAQVLKRS